MNADRWIDSKQLALQLAALDSSNREMLLSELPALKREELEALIKELEPLRKDAFAFQMAMAELDSDSSTTGSLFTEQRLQQLLIGESFALKQQVIDIFVRGQSNRVTPHVQSAITQYLQKKSSTIPAETNSSAQLKPWWKIWS